MEKYANNLLKTVFLPLLMVVVISATDCKASIYEESIAVCSEWPERNDISNNN